MKPLQCEMCGGSDLIKQDGVFVCQFCGTKYSVEEAKKLMIEGIVEVKGSVSIDHTNEINNYLLRAKEFVNRNDYDSAETYYNRVLDLDPNNTVAKNRIKFLESVITSTNLTIHRIIPRSSGEYKTILLINGTKRKEYDLDNTCNISLPVGVYDLQFKRGVLKSSVNTISINDKYDKYSIDLKPGLFSIRVDVNKY